jgi:lipid A disaccharide synthetase
VLDRLAVPELYYPNATPSRIAEETQRLLDDGPERRAQLAAFSELRELLGPPDAATRAARIALSMLE